MNRWWKQAARECLDIRILRRYVITWLKSCQRHAHEPGRNQRSGRAAGHILELAARKSGDSRVTAWRSVHAAYRGVVRERWLATRGGSPRRSAKGTPGSGVRATPLSRGDGFPCEDSLHEQICARSS